jgi:Trk K+ transport system NAD-binding subunit
VPDESPAVASATGPEAAPRQRFVVCGDTPLALRVIDQLVSAYDGQVTVILRSATENRGPQIAQLEWVSVVESDRLDAETFTRAGLAGAVALGLLDQDDAGNVDAALIAQELNPRVRIAIRMFNYSLGERMSTLLNDCVVLSAAAIAAPAFVAAALDETATAPMRVADRTLVATPRAAARAEAVVAGLAVVEGRDEPETLPPTDNLADLVLARATTSAPPRPRRRRRGRLQILPILWGGRTRLVLLVLLAILAAATAVLALFDRMRWAQAAYVALLSELGGANADPHATGVEGITLTVLTVVSIALIPVLTATVVDAAVKARLRAEAGGLTEPVSGHVIVVGLGNVGTRVVSALHDAGVDVVAVDRDVKARGVQAARDRQIPVIIGDASRAEILAAASIQTCRTLVIVSTDDMTNLETALLGRAANPALRVVLRLFDGDFADRVGRAFGITASRSVSYLAAPAFAAAMLGQQIIATIPVRRRVLVVAEVPVEAESMVDGATVGEIDRPNEVRLLAVDTGRDGQVLWSPPAGRRLTRTDRLYIVATRAGLGRLLTDAAGPPAAEAPRHTPLSRWDMPQPRAGAARAGGAVGGDAVPPGSSERPSEPHPLGPADGDSTRPA